MAIYKPYNEKISSLLEQTRNRELVLPEFQRDFVWDPDQIVELLISITKEYPCGSLLFLSTGGRKKFGYRPIGDMKKPSRTPRLMVLDGQQRLTSLFHAFHGYGEYDFFMNIEALNEDDDVSEDTFFYYTKSETEEYLPSRNDEFRDYSLPLRTVFDMKYDFDEWFDDFLEYHEDNEDFDITKKDLRYIKRQYINPIREYAFPILEVPDTVPENVVCEIFEVLNKTGTKLNVFELLTAKLWTKGIHLRDLWQEAESGCPEVSRYGIDSVTFLRSLSMLSRNESRASKKEYLYKLRAKDFKEYWTDLIKAHNELFILMREELGVLKGKWIPYKLLAPVMAAALVRLNRDYTRLEKAKRKKDLKDWYWNTTFYEYVDRYTESRAGRDFLDLVSWFEDDEEPEAMEEFSFDENRLIRSGPNKALYKGILNLLVLNGAKDFHTAEYIKTRLEMDTTIDDHHIFPRRYLEKRRIDPQKANCIVNRTLIDGTTNTSIGSKKPSDYLKEIAGHLGKRQLNSILESHRISSKSNRSIFKDDFNGFFEYRKSNLLRMIKDVCSFPDQ